MALEPLGYYKWHWQAWRANRRVQRMSWQAKAHYREMLDEFWAEGALPSDMKSLSEIAGCSEEEFTAVWHEIEPHWIQTDAGLINLKMDEQRTTKDAQRIALANAGKSGGIAKQKLANATPVKAKAKQKPSKSHIEREREERDIAQDEPAGLFSEVKAAIFRAYEKKNQVTPEWNGREGKALSELLSANPSADILHWTLCLKGWFESDINHGERPGVWISRLSSYRKPVNAYNRPKESSSDQARPITVAEKIARSLAQ